MQIILLFYSKNDTSNLFSVSLSEFINCRKSNFYNEGWKSGNKDLLLLYDI